MLLFLTIFSFSVMLFFLSDTSILDMNFESSDCNNCSVCNAVIMLKHTLKLYTSLFSTISIFFLHRQ